MALAPRVSVQAAPQIPVISWTVGAIFLMFIIYITAKGELGLYLSLMIPNISPSPATGTGTQSGGAQNPSTNAVPGIGGTLFPNYMNGQSQLPGIVSGIDKLFGIGGAK